MNIKKMIKTIFDLVYHYLNIQFANTGNKMSKINLNEITGGYNLSSINANFTKIAEALNDRALYRNNIDGEPNHMENNLDMNSYRILNLPDPTEPLDVIRLKDLEDILIPVDPTDPTEPDLTGKVVRLEDYVEEGDLYFEQAWDRYVLDRFDTESDTYGTRTIHIGRNPNTSDGTWNHFEPVDGLGDTTYLDEGYTHVWVSTDDTVSTRRSAGMIQFVAPDPTVTTEISSPVTEEDTTLTVTSTAGMEAGGYVEINVNPQVDFTTGVFPRVTRFNRVTEIVSATEIKIDTPIYWDLPVSTGIKDVKFFPEDTVPKNITIKGMRFYDDSFQGLTPGVPVPSYTIGPLYFQHASNVFLKDIKGYNLKLPLVQFNRFHSVYADTLESIRPTAREGGEGYTIQCSNGAHVYLSNIKGQATRHVLDFTSVSHAMAVNCIADKPSGFVYADYTLHGQAEDNITFINCVGTNWGLDSDTNQFGGYSKKIHFLDCNFSGTTTPRQGLQVKYTNCYLGAWRGTSNGIAADVEFDSCSFNSDTEINFVGDSRVDGTDYKKQLVMKGVGSVRCSDVNITDFDSVFIGDEVEFVSGGASNGLVIFLDTLSVVSKCKTDNVVFTYQGDCRDITVGNKMNLTANGPTRTSWAIGGSALTSVDPIKFKVLPETHIKGKVGGTIHRPVLLQQGSGTATDVEITWNGGTFEDFEDLALLVDSLSYSGTINGVNFGSTGIAYRDSGTPSTLPSTIITSGNYYDDLSNNYESVSGAVFEEMSVRSGVTAVSLPTSIGAISLSSAGFTSSVGISGASLSATDITLPAGNYSFNLNLSVSRASAVASSAEAELEVISGDTKTIPLMYLRGSALSSTAVKSNSGVSRSFSLNQESVINLRIKGLTGMTIEGTTGVARGLELQIVKVG